MTTQTYDGYYVEPIEIKTDYGYSVDCYGDIDSDSVIVMAFDDENFDGISESSFDTWSEAVKECSDYAKSVGTTLVQLEAE